jgi:hypothetical protein
MQSRATLAAEKKKLLFTYFYPVVKHHTLKAYIGCGGKDPHVLYFGTGRRCVVSFTIP